MQVTVVDHPLIKQKITKMRAEHTSSRDFRECLDEIAMLMTYEVENFRRSIHEESDICRRTKAESFLR